MQPPLQQTATGSPKHLSETTDHYGCPPLTYSPRTADLPEILYMSREGLPDEALYPGNENV